jgi:predicted aspartyl protease
MRVSHMIASLSRIVLAAAASFAARECALADTCPPLLVLASVPVVYDISGHAFVPVTLQSAHKLMLVDTGGAFSEITQATADALALPRRHAPIRQYGISGQYSDETAEADDFAIGNLVAHHIDFMIEPDGPKSADAQNAGIIGPNILRNYDVEFDFGANRFKLMSQDHCPGKVVYWPAATVAQVPIDIAGDTGHIVVPVTLDGVALHALIDTGAANTFISARVAENDFALELGSARAPAAGAIQGGARIYRSRFHALSLRGIAVSNPVITIIPDLMRSALSNAAPTGAEDAQPRNMIDIALGMDVLRHLHLYVGYKEHMLYATPTSDSPMPPAPNSAPPPAALR